MSEKRRITEYLDIDLERETWCCHVCGKELISAREDYKKGCLLYARDPREIHRPLLDVLPAHAPSPQWTMYVEFYCPSCGTMINVEQYPPGHPIMPDIALEVDKLTAKYLGRQAT